MEKIVLGAFETIILNGKKIKAKIDTGADRSSICKSLINELGLKQSGKKIKITSAHGTTRRGIYKGEVIIKGKKLAVDFTAIDRSKLNARVLLGKDVLEKGFLVDVLK